MTTDNSLESRLARAAVDLDSAAERYENRRSLAPAPSTGVRTRVRMGLSVGIVGLAASLVLGVTLARNTVDPGISDTAPVAIDVPGQLVLSLPIGDGQRESVRFIEGVATSPPGGPTYRIRRRETFDEQVGTKALLIDRTDDTARQPSSLVVLVDSNDTLLASQSEFGPEIQSMGVDNGKLLTFVHRFDTLVDITTFAVAGAVLEPTAKPRRISRYELSADKDTAPELRFEPGTTSALVVVDRGQRRGWLMAREGQQLRIDQRSLPTGARRAAQVKLQRNSTSPSAPLAMLFPEPFTTVLPEDGRYELVVEGGDPITIEITIR